MKKQNLLLTLLMFTLTSCNTNNPDISNLSIVCPAGAPAVAFYAYANDANFETNSVPSNIVSMMNSKNGKDIIVIDSVTGIKAINNGAEYKLAANITFGNFFLASTGNDDNDQLDADDNIILFGQNQTADFIFDLVYGKDNYNNIEFVTAANDAAACLASGRNVATGTIADYVFLAQPALYAQLHNQNAATYGKSSVYQNIQDLYYEATDGKEMIQASIFVKNSLSKDVVNAFLDKISSDINNVITDTSVIDQYVSDPAASEMVSKYGVNLNVAKAVINDNNSLGLGFKKAIDNKTNIDTFISLFGMSATDEEIYFK